MTTRAKKERAARARPWAPAWGARDNAGYIQTKIEIRRKVLDAVGKASVFDAFAGEGQMWKAVWHEAAAYVGCDERWHNDARCCFVGDNHRVMRAIDLAAFNVFDLDAYGSPWDQLTILATRRKLRPKERIGVVLTEGTWLKTRAKDPVRGLRDALPRKLVTPIPYSVHDELIGRALRYLIGRMGGRIVHTWIAIGLTGAKVRYIGLVIESAARTPAPAPEPAPAPKPAKPAPEPAPEPA